MGILDNIKVFTPEAEKKRARLQSNIPNLNKKKAKRKVAVIDFETDPFMFGRVPEPFCVEFYSDDITQVFWGKDCANQLIDFLRTLEEPHLIYAHNGGKFDFHFILIWLENPALIIKTRITEAHLFQHTLRDSFSILPVPLRDYEKMEFDYSKMEHHCRDKYKRQILEYLHSDCIHLYTLVSAFVSRFGARLTIGGTAMREIKKLHPFIKSGRRHDELFRRYYYGGRVQVFEHGIITGPVKLVDVNSMYSASMRNRKHPINGRFDIAYEMPKSFDMPFFITFQGKNTNALPSIADDGLLVFSQKEGIFNACSHEVEIALEHGLIEIDEVLECLISTEAISFDLFVDKFFEEKTICKANKDKIGELFAKLLLNSGYGRFGINPDNFADWIIHRDFGNEDDLIEQGYSQACDYEEIELWSKPTNITDDDFCDVAVAASITSGARAILLEGLQHTSRPYYCDTDSIICADFHGDVDRYRLGAWDLEKTANMLAIGGKKMYALYDDKDIEVFAGNIKSHTSMLCSKCKLPFKDAAKHRAHQLDCNVKLSSKGGSLSLPEIVSIAKGESIYFENDAPTFSLKRDPMFVKRNFKSTVDLDDATD